MDYIEAKKYIENTGARGIIPGTKVIRELLGRLGNPKGGLKAIHVAGTNGKGSVCAYLEAGLLECGLSVGRYSSPAVFDYLEKIRFMGENITEEDYAETVDRVRDAAESMEHKPTSFEAETAAAFLYFSRKKADVVIVECGMGGREDATNVFESPLASVITPVSMDHMKYLGNDPYEIAENKAGIMKMGCPAVISAMPKVIFEEEEYDPEAFLAEYAGEVGAIVYRAAEFKVPEGVKNPLPGSFQEVNLQTAFCTFQVIKNELIDLHPNLIRSNDKISSDTFAQGIEKTRHPGRYEKLNNALIIIRDGAHNPAAARALRDALDNDGELPGNKRVHLIMGVFKDKDYESILRIMLPGAASFTAIDLPDENRGLPAAGLVEAAKCVAHKLGLKYRIAVDNNGEGTRKGNPSEENAGLADGILCISKTDSLGEALDTQSCSSEDVFVVFGSLSLMQLFKGII